jgi:hypothetical protein
MALADRGLRLGNLLLLVWLSSFLACSGADRQTAASVSPEDVMTLPAVRQAFLSPAGDYRFVISNTDNWQSEQTTGSLTQVQPGGASVMLWQRRLPQAYGPRFVVVGPQGQVLLLDEQINVASAYAVMLLSPTGELLAQYSFDALQRLSGVTRAEIVAQASIGWWLGGPPTLEGDLVAVPTAGKTLRINLVTGQVDFRR